MKKHCETVRYSDTQRWRTARKGVIPVKVEDLPGIEVGGDWGSPDGDKTVFLRFLGRESEDDV